MIKIETSGSYWFIDEDTKRYMRTPKEEKPRQWASEGTVLQDLVWHDFDSWEIRSEPFALEDSIGTLHWAAASDLPRLVIYTTEDRKTWATAPRAYVAF